MVPARGGDHDEWSDVDLAISCPQAAASDWLEIQAICAQEEMLVKVESTRYDQIKDETFKAQVERDKKVLYEQHR